MVGSYKEIVAQIEGLNEEISRWSRYYQTVTEQQQIADREIMALHRKKWQLEMLITPVIKVLPKKVDKQAKIRKDLKIEDMSESEILLLLEMMRAMKEGDVNEEGEEDASD
jgi:hypothetical protein